MNFKLVKRESNNLLWTWEWREKVNSLLESFRQLNKRLSEREGLRPIATCCFRLVAGLVFNVHLLHAFTFSKKLLWLAQTNVTTVKMQTHAKTWCGHLVYILYYILWNILKSFLLCSTGSEFEKEEGCCDWWLSKLGLHAYAVNLRGKHWGSLLVSIKLRKVILSFKMYYIFCGNFIFKFFLN